MSDPRFADVAIEVVKLELAALEYVGGWFPAIVIGAAVLAAGCVARLLIVLRKLRQSG